MKFIPLKRSQLESIPIGTKLYGSDGEELILRGFDKTNSPVKVENETEDYVWKTLKKVSLIKPKGGFEMESFKQYLEKHRDSFFTIGVVLVLDHFVFAGAFREKLKQMVDSILDKKTKAITNGE